MRRRAPLLALGCLALLVALGVGACTPSGPRSTPSPSPSETAPFKTDEEALAAAKAAYEKYRSVVDAVFRDGGIHPERFNAVATGTAKKELLNSAARLHEDGQRLTGRTLVDRVRLQYYSPSEAEVAIYACQDISATDVVDSSGRSVVDSARQGRIPRQVQLVTSANSLLVALDGIWTGENFCS